MRLWISLALLLVFGGCAHKQLTNRQVAEGVGVVAVGALVFYAMAQSHDNDHFGM